MSLVPPLSPLLFDADHFMDGPCHRLWLGRKVSHGNLQMNIDGTLPDMVIFLMLNPSKARGVGVGDPTQRKCDGFAGRLGARRYGIVNLFSYSTPYPKELFEWGYPNAVGALNDEMLTLTLKTAGERGWPVILAYGKPSLPKSQLQMVEKRVAEVFRLRLALEGVKPVLNYLDLAEGRWPRHPLMLGYDKAELQPY